MSIGLELQDALNKYINKGAFGKTEPAYNSIVNAVPASIEQFVKQNVISENEWIVNGSVGKGNWAETPWMGIFYKKVTNKASSGFYIVLLVGKDCDSIFLTMANSVTNQEMSISSAEVVALNPDPKWIKSSLPPGSLSTKPNSLGSSYEPAVVFYTKYQKSQLHASSIEEDLAYLLKVYIDTASAKLSASESHSYWVLGATWGTEDKSEAFTNESKWENGYQPADDNASTEKVKRVEIGDYVALKSSFQHNGESVTRIKAVGRVTANPGDGVRLEVNWNFKGPYFDIRGMAYRKTIEEVQRTEHQQLIFHNSYSTVSIPKVNTSSDTVLPDLPKNLILYGPPGVGKTHRISQLRQRFEYSGASASQESAWIEKLAWWEVIAVTLRDLGKFSSVPEIINHKFIQTKAKQSNNNNLRATTWGQLQYHTIRTNQHVNVVVRGEPYIFEKDGDSLWALVADSKELVDELFDRQEDASDSSGNKRYEFVTFHQSLSYEDFVEGIRPNLNESGDLNYQLHKGVFRSICERASADPDNSYAIFIDEINRGNISKIFGELITLIEEDKRITGAKEDLFVTLPYSQVQFGVPQNLHIIGTMNTADRSIAIIDTALRRRFEFEELKPNLMLIPEQIEGIQLRAIVAAMNKLISKSISHEYALGHSYFMSTRCFDIKSLMRVWNHQILPLLKEYFWDSAEKLIAIAKPFLEIEEDALGEGSQISQLKFVTEEDEFQNSMLELERHLGL